MQENIVILDHPVLSRRGFAHHFEDDFKFKMDKNTFKNANLEPQIQ